MIKKDNWIKYSIKKFLISSATYWLSPSKNSDKYLIHYGATEDKIYRYPFTSIKENDIVNYSSNFDEKKEIRNKLDINSYDKIILGVGKFIYRKGFDILLKAHKNNADDVALLIVGGSPIEEYKKNY